MDSVKNCLRKWGWALSIGILLLLLVLPPDMLGRPGGGSSYSGGGGSHSSGGGGGYSGGGGGSSDGAGLIILLIQYPQIGIPVIVIIILYRIYASRKAAPESVITNRTGRDNLLWNRRKVDNALWEYREQHDPEFSQTLFLDFAQHLYYQYHHHRTHREVLNLQPYFKADIIAHAAPKGQFRIDVTELVVGGADFASLYVGDGQVTLAVRFDANYTETIDGHSNRWWVQETWFFSREAHLRSPGPEALQSPGCPNCGASLELSASGACRQCDTVVTPGKQAWFVSNIVIAQREVQHGAAVGTYAPEQGTNLPTLYDSRLNAMGQRFAQLHKLDSFTDYALTFRQKVVEPIFRAVYRSWSERNYATARPVMSDHLFRSHLYWIETYQRHQRINRLDNLSITAVHLVKLDLDRYYEAATVRIFAAVLDYLTDENGKVVAGNPRSPRAFSEYWTFVRRSGVEADEKQFNPDLCPNCGAPVNMGMTGSCSYCGSKVTTGNFGWILSRITQDEAYYG